MESFLCQESTELLHNLLSLSRSMKQHPVVMRLLLSRAVVAAKTYRRRWDAHRRDISARDRMIAQLYQQLREVWAWMTRTLSAAQIIDAVTELFHQQATWIPPEIRRTLPPAEPALVYHPEEDV